MGVGLIFSIWILVGAVFLAKLARVRGLVARLRCEPVPVHMAVVLVLCGAIIHASTKTNAPDATLSSAPRSCSTSSTTTTTPSWWRGDDTDTDGIPDLREKWTHGNPHVADGCLDRDGDGLSDLGEFQNQTDPRTADTDADG